MPFRSVRLTDFNTDRPPGAPWDVELLCRDARGVYVLPFPGRRLNANWINARTNETLEVEVLGWRLWEDRFMTDLKTASAPRLAATRDSAPVRTPEKGHCDARPRRASLGSDSD